MLVMLLKDCYVYKYYICLICMLSKYESVNFLFCSYALLGAASFLGGSMRMTVSLCVIMVEITNNLKLLPLIMLVLLISKASLRNLLFANFISFRHQVCKT